MKYTLLTNTQLSLLTMGFAIITASVIALTNMYINYNLLPKVIYNTNGECIKVINFENGHAFNCNDLDVVLRIYRNEKDK